MKNSFMGILLALWVLIIVLVAISVNLIHKKETDSKVIPIVLTNPLPDYNEEIKANERACRDATLPDGFASYPVTHWGELRGCLRVRKDASPATPTGMIFIRKERQL